MKGKVVKQINNIKITQLNSGEFAAWSPDNRLLGNSLDYNALYKKCESCKRYVKNSTAIIRLYHGSIGGIQGNISTNANKTVCDFGHGFYTGNNIRQAESRVSNVKNPIVYTYDYSIEQCKTYKFTDDVLWALFIGCNRNYIKHIPNKLLTTFQNILSHEVIIGKIADDKISMVFNDFLNGNITDRCLHECLKLVRYGDQYVFKTDEAIYKALTLVGSYSLSKQDRINSLNWGTQLKKDMESSISSLKREYRRTGRFIDECLEDFA